jgi:hypothetical protein
MISLPSITALLASLKPTAMPVAPVACEIRLLRSAAALGVHEVHADRVVVEAVAFDEVVVGEHEVDGVAAARPSLPR